MSVRVSPRKRRFRPTLPEENTIARRYAQALAQARYRNAADAARICLRSLRRAGLGRSMDETQVACKLRHLSLSYGRKLRYKRWSETEHRIIDRFARRLAAGRYACANDAIPDCRQALKQAGLCGHVGERTIGNKLRHRSRQLGRRLVFLHWTAAQDRVAARFARAIVKGAYPDATAAVPDCVSALKAAGERVSSSRQGISAKLWRMAREMGLAPSARRWCSQEIAATAQLSRKYYDHRAGKARMGLCTIARMMQANLRRLGYERSFYACKGALVN